MSSKMWHSKPASEFLEGYPIGNGRLAAMVLGGVAVERIALNHEWLWRARRRHRDFKPPLRNLDEIRRLFFEGKMFEAGTLANKSLGSSSGGGSGLPNRIDPYQPAGDLFLEFGHTDASGYRRELDLSTGVARVSYKAGETEFHRECFVHAARSVICVRARASAPEALAATVRLSRVADPDCTLAFAGENACVRMVGEFTEGSRFCVAARVLASAGRAACDDRPGTVTVDHANEILALLSIAVAHDGQDCEAEALGAIRSAPPEWDLLLREHTDRFSPLYHRVALDLGKGDDSKPTDERVARLSGPWARDDDLTALYFNLGRYLLISSTLAADLPPNLQGKWNEDPRPPWDCDLHHDVNLQMNYWPAEPCNQPESTEALFGHMERLVPHAREMARAIYGCRGVVFPIQCDPWGRATPESQGWDVWTGAAAWLAQHMWWRWEWGGDAEFLRRRAYPFFKEAAAFYEDYLVRHPAKGWLVTVPSQSPENTFAGGTRPVSLCVAATMDLELIHDLLTHAVRASEILDVDADLREKWRAILAELPPLQVGRHDQLQEWLEDYEECEPGHRHISHLFGLFPGDQLTLAKEPALTKAARMSLLRRLAAGGGHTGWSRAWTVCCLARLGEGDLALNHLRHLIADHTTPSLLDLHPPRIFQIDGNLGGTAGVAEMLLQSHESCVRLLPALPRAWTAGSFRGLAARGGFEVDVAWRDGAILQATIRSTRGGPCRVRWGEKTLTLATQAGGVYRLDGELRETGSSDQTGSH